MMAVQLYDSTICRLCAAENGNEQLFVSETGETDLSSLVNRYLPLKVRDDGKLPRTICPGCNIQLEATVQFLQLLIEGQQKLREMWKNEIEQRKAQRLKDKKENIEFGAEGIRVDSTVPSNEDDQYEQQIIVKIMPDGSMYAAEHEMSLQMEGLTKPRRKRGRPPKIHTEADTLTMKENLTEIATQAEEDKQEEEIDEDGDGRRRRKRKVPKRFMEAVQGKELERIFKEEGVIDEEDDDDADALDDLEETLNTTTQDGQEEVIGHLETEEGKDLGELVVVNRVRARGKTKLNRKRTKFTCQLCGRGFLQRSRFIVHKSFHKGVKYECAQCKKLFTSKDNLALHQKTTQHSSNLVEENVEIQNSLERIEAVNATEEEIAASTTEKTKLNKGFSCDICGKVLNHPSSVVYHKEAEHNNGRRFVCNKCGKSFKHKQLLQRHQLVHSDDRPYVCKSCNASFKTKANLLNHSFTHTGEKKYFCELCGQQFAHKTSLTLHYRWHTGHKPYTCEVCQKSFSQNGNLQEHMRIHTGEKPYCCDYCGRKFTTSSQFKLHVKRHTGERPWKCEFCAKCFLHKDTWKCHVRRHKGERPFQCTHCNRGFTEQWALKKHFRLHTGEKPYSCDLCGKAFADCSNLTKHKKVHRENKVLSAGESEHSPIGEVWQILPNAQEADEQTLNDQMAQVITTDEASTDGIQQIIYVSYQDPDDPNQSRTLHFVDTSMMRNKDEVTSHTNSLPRLDVENEMIADKIVNNTAANNNEEQPGIELSESDLQLQITDEEGNPIPLSLQETRQLLSQGHFISQLSDGQTIRVHSGMLAQQLPQTLSIHVDEEAAVAAAIKGGEIMARPNAAKSVETMSVVQTDAEAIVKALEDEDTDATTVAAINQLEGGITDGSEQTIEFTTQDGQKVRVLTSYHVDEMQLTPEYLTIV